MPGLLRGMARTAVVAGTATAVSNRVSRRQARRWSDQDAQQQAPDNYYESQPAAGGITQDQINQLEQLGDLKAKGILTEEEFSRKKAEVLNP